MFICKALTYCYVLGALCGRGPVILEPARGRGGAGAAVAECADFSNFSLIDEMCAGQVTTPVFGHYASENNAVTQDDCWQTGLSDITPRILPFNLSSSYHPQPGWHIEWILI